MPIDMSAFASRVVVEGSDGPKVPREIDRSNFHPIKEIGQVEEHNMEKGKEERRNGDNYGEKKRENKRNERG